MGRPVLEVADIFRDHGAAWRRANAGYVSLPEFWREVQHLSALSLLDFPFLGAAFASSKYSGRRRRGRENPIFPWCARASQGVALRVRIHPALIAKSSAHETPHRFVIKVNHLRSAKARVFSANC